MDKIKMFKRYAKNLKIVREKLKFEINGSSEETEIFICPLSLKVFDQDGLSSKYADQLTIEHVPPKSLGGRGVTLTNKISNSQAGHTLDSNLLAYLLHQDFNSGRGSIPVKYKFDNKITINGEIQSGDNLSLKFKPKEMHQGAQKILNLLQTEKEFPISFSFVKPSDPAIALLRIAYLLAFSTLGYSFLFGATKYINPNIDKIRRQINSPSEQILTEVPVLKWHLPDDFLGVNIIYEPKEVRALLVVFDLKTSHKQHRFCAILPGPDDFGFSAFKNLRDILVINKTVDFKAYVFPEKLMLESPTDSFKYWYLWEELNSFTRI